MTVIATFTKVDAACSPYDAQADRSMPNNVTRHMLRPVAPKQQDLLRQLLITQVRLTPRQKLRLGGGPAAAGEQRALAPGAVRLDVALGYASAVVAAGSVIAKLREAYVQSICRPAHGSHRQAADHRCNECVGPHVSFTLNSCHCNTAKCMGQVAARLLLKPSESVQHNPSTVITCYHMHLPTTALLWQQQANVHHCSQTPST